MRMIGLNLALLAVNAFGQSATAPFDVASLRPSCPLPPHCGQFFCAPIINGGPGNLIDNGEARQYVADLLNVGRSTLFGRWRRALRSAQNRPLIIRFKQKIKGTV